MKEEEKVMYDKKENLSAGQARLGDFFKSKRTQLKSDIIEIEDVTNNQTNEDDFCNRARNSPNFNFRKNVIGGNSNKGTLMEIETNNSKNFGKLTDPKKIIPDMNPQAKNAFNLEGKDNDIEVHLRLLMSMVSDLHRGQHSLNKFNLGNNNILSKDLPLLLRDNPQLENRLTHESNFKLEDHEKKIWTLSNVSEQVIEKVRRLDSDVGNLVNYGRYCIEPWKNEISGVAYYSFEGVKVLEDRINTIVNVFLNLKLS